jgi:RNA polymerase sigma factor (sigma-70 family)
MNSPSSEYIHAGSIELYRACGSAEPQVQASAYQALWQYLCRVALQIVYDQADRESLAQDCAQVALIRVHERLAECTEPAAFFAWARRIVANVAIDELRRQKRMAPLGDDDLGHDDVLSSGPTTTIETSALERIDQSQLRAIIQRAPISARSARVVLGRYFDDLPDEVLAQTESRLAGQPVRPSHIQVTRTKDIARLRRWEPLRAFLKPPEQSHS